VGVIVGCTDADAPKDGVTEGVGVGVTDTEGVKILVASIENCTAPKGILYYLLLLFYSKCL
jgi:hypothetical protein